MKKMMRMMTAALLAIACLPMTAVPAVHAEEASAPVWEWENTFGDSLGTMERIDSMTGINLSNSRVGTYFETYLRTFDVNGLTRTTIYAVTSRDRFLRFKLRDGVSEEEAMPRILAVLEKYYPSLKANFDPEACFAAVPAGVTDYRYADYQFGCTVEDGVYEIRECRAAEPSKEVGESIRKDLAAKGLISEFYNWGQTCEYQDAYSRFESVLTYSKYQTETVEDTSVTFQESAVEQETFRSIFADHQIDLEDLRSLYEAHPGMDPFEMLALSDDEMQYFQLAGVDAVGKHIRFYKVVNGDHVQYYASIQDLSKVSEYLSTLPGDSELFALSDGQITAHPVKHTENPQDHKVQYVTTERDLEPLRTYLAVHHPGYEIADVKYENAPDGMIQIVPSEELSYKEQLELIGEIYAAVNMIPDFMILESPSQKVVGHNDMENPGDISLDDSQSVRASMYMDSGAAKLTGHNDMEKPGDANLDGENTILDVIAVNKCILGGRTLDKTGVKNADMNGNGTTDPDDSLAILKAVIA